MVKIMMKTIILSLGIVLAAGLMQNALAQRGGGGEQFILKYGEQLELTDAQKEQILALGSERRSELRGRMQNVRDRGVNQRGNRQDRQRPNPDQRQQLRMEQSGEFRAEFMEVLTESQQQQLIEIRVEEIDSRHDLMELRHKGMVERAGLEGEKADTVLAIMSRNSAEMAEIQKDRVLNDTALTREEMQAQREKTLEAHEQIKNLLTAAEYEKLQQEMRSNRPAGQQMMLNRNRNR